MARSQVFDAKRKNRGSRWSVPDSLHAPILQSGVLLARAATRPGPRAFLAFLHGPEAHRVLQRYGYSPPLVLVDSPIEGRINRR